MDLIYTCYRSQATLKRGAAQLEGNSLTSVSSNNCLLFTASAPMQDQSGVWRCHVLCADLNTPWSASPVCSLEGEATCLAWDARGERFLVADSGGTLQVWERKEESGGEWKRLTMASYPLENFVTGGFFLTSRPVCVNDERRESVFYNEKFSSCGVWRRTILAGCVLVSSSGLVVCLAFPSELEPLITSKSLGLGRRRVEQADTATTKDGKFVVAACSSMGPVIVYAINAAVRQDGGLDLRLATHSSFSVIRGEDEVRVCSLRFLLPDCSSALVVGVQGGEGGKVQMWQLEGRQRQVHKLFASNGSGRDVPEWRYTDEFSGGGSRVVGVVSPRSSVMGGARPSCYVAVAFSDGSVQCLLRDSLQQIESVELPRGGNLGWGGKTVAPALTICSLSFTATGNCLVVIDSLGQLYLYSMSPIADPGGPSSAPFTVQALEYCLVSGKDWWDLAVAFKPPSKLEAVADRFAESFAAQPSGVRSYYHSRFMSMKASLYRLAGSSLYRAADTSALLMLQSVNAAFKTLLRLADGAYSDSDPATKLEMVLTGPEETAADIEPVIAALTGSGLARDVAALDGGTVQAMQQLAAWATTLALHLLASVPEYRARRGPGFQLLTGPEALPLLRELLCMLRLWNLARPPIISLEKEFDLIARLFNLVTRLMKKHEDEALIDECLMLPHKVMIPALDTVQGSRGLAACIASHSSPVTFVLGQEPDLPPSTPPPFMEGLSYTEDQNSNLFYDSIQKMYLGCACPKDYIWPVVARPMVKQLCLWRALDQCEALMSHARSEPVTDFKDFKQKEYWDDFFKKRGKKAFEWYGEYGELCGILHKYTKATDTILQVGCGNSTLASDLYDVGYRSIRSIDISDLVISMMSEKNKQRKELIFEKMDATAMRYDDGSYSVVLDKGTLDALFTDTSEPVVARVEAMFNEIGRVLKLGGRYLCVSLLQEHILKHIVTWFSSRGWPLRILRCIEAEESKSPQDRGMPVFVIVATKFRKVDGVKPILELGLTTSGQLTRVEMAEQLVESVRGVQQFAALRANLAGGGDATQGEVSLDLRPANSEAPRYSLFLADRTPAMEKQVRSVRPFAAFVVPEGREVEWLFASAEGRAQLCESAGPCARLVVVHLGRQHTFASLNQVQEELGGYVLELAPPSLPSGYQVPFLSAGAEEVGKREERCRGHSSLSGEYVVEDVTVGADTLRRLVFLSRPHLTQSEALLKPAKAKSKGKKGKLVVDRSTLASTYHGVMVGALGLYFSAPVKVLVVGLGGGGLPNYIHATFPLSNIHVVELDPAIVRVASDQFSFHLDDRLTVSTRDGIAFINETKEHFSLIMLDVDSKDISSGMSCPPPAFLEPAFLASMARVLGEDGTLVLNLVCRDSILRAGLMASISAVWSTIISYKLEEEVNEVLFCSSSQKLRTSESKQKVNTAFKLVNDHVRKVTKVQEDLIDLEDSLKLLKVAH